MTSAIRVFTRRFRIRSLLIACTCLAVAVAWFSAPWRRQAAAVARLTSCASFQYKDRWQWLTDLVRCEGNPHGVYGGEESYMLRRLAARILGLHGASEAFGAVLNSDRLEDPSLLSDLPKLTHLTVTIERGTGPPLAEIVAQTPGLIELCVDLKRPLSAEDFQAIRKLPRLRDLYLKVPDDEHFEECLREITAYQDVESISGDCMSLSPTMVRYLVAAPGYYRLDIGCHDPPDAALLERLARAQQSANVQELTGDMRSTDGLPLHVRFSDGPKTKLNPP